MDITIPYLQQKFDEFNQQMFSGKLPPIPIQLSHAKTFLGQCVFKRRVNLLGRRENYDFRLKISTRIPMSEQLLEDTLIHEMIHYYIGVNQLRDTSVHGSIFRQMMTDINTRFGRHLSISHRGTKEQTEQAHDQRIRYRVVAVVQLKNGLTGMKVLPHTSTSILKYYNTVTRGEGVLSVQLYVSKDVFFGRYPASSVPRAHILERELIMSHLQDAERLGCDGKSIHPLS